MSNYICAQPPTNLEALPPGWSWWERPVPEEWSTEYADHGGDEPPAGPGWSVVWTGRYRLLTRAHLAAATEAAVADWLAPETTDSGAVASLPPGWGTLARVSIGYTAHGHVELMGLEDRYGVEERLRETVRDGETEDHLVRLASPSPPWHRDGLSQRRVLARAGVPGWARARRPVTVPEGWGRDTTHLPMGSLADYAPAGMSADGALTAWDHAHGSDLTTIVVAERDTWLAWIGIGGRARQVGSYGSRDEAVLAALVAITAGRERYSWVPDMAPISIIDAPSPGWAALANAQ